MPCTSQGYGIEGTGKPSSQSTALPPEHPAVKKPDLREPPRAGISGSCRTASSAGPCGAGAADADRCFQYVTPVIKYDRNGFKARDRLLVLTQSSAYVVEMAKIKQKIDYTTLRGKGGGQRGPPFPLVTPRLGGRVSSWSLVCRR